MVKTIETCQIRFDFFLRFKCKLPKSYPTLALDFCLQLKWINVINEKSCKIELHNYRIYLLNNCNVTHIQINARNPVTVVRFASTFCLHKLSTQFKAKINYKRKLISASAMLAVNPERCAVWSGGNKWPP